MFLFSLKRIEVLFLTKKFLNCNHCVSYSQVSETVCVKNYYSKTIVLKSNDDCKHGEIVKLFVTYN